MSSHDHHDNHSNEPKAVSFTVPFILASVTLVLIFLFLSLCDPKKHGECECKEDCSKECMEACEKGDHSKHPATMGHEEHNADAKSEHTETKDTMAVETSEHTATDTTHKEAAHEAHH
ncbi:MAG: hypothetical protein JNJ41_12685 [Bacteroidia bacterium]|nr:hypothetical protein [Bacteroidia bacterium]